MSTVHENYTLNPGPMNLTVRECIIRKGTEMHEDELIGQFEIKCMLNFFIAFDIEEGVLDLQMIYE